jgi:hypothetical protein
MKRRTFLQLLAGASVGAGLLVPKRSIFLPPIGGWPGPYARLIIPRSDIGPWAEGIASGKYHYDMHTEMLSLMEFDQWQTKNVTPISIKAPLRNAVADDAYELRAYARARGHEIVGWTDQELVDDYKSREVWGGARLVC